MMEIKLWLLAARIMELSEKSSLETEILLKLFSFNIICTYVWLKSCQYCRKIINLSTLTNKIIKKKDLLPSISPYSSFVKLFNWHWSPYIYFICLLTKEVFTKRDKLSPIFISQIPKPSVVNRKKTFCLIKSFSLCHEKF